MTPTQIWVLVFVSCVAIVTVAFVLSWFSRLKYVAYGLALVALTIAIVYSSACSKELTADEQGHQTKIEEALVASDHGWLIETSDKTVYKIYLVTRNQGGPAALVDAYADLHTQLRERVGSGGCLQCAGYFVRVVGPDDPDYADLALRFAKQ